MLDKPSNSHGHHCQLRRHSYTNISNTSHHMIPVHTMLWMYTKKSGFIE